MSGRTRTVFRIRRFHPDDPDNAETRRFEIETRPGMTVLDALHRIREEHDATLSYRYSCRMGICGSCAMVMNGQPGLACNTQVHHVSIEQVTLEPLWNFPVIKDLVTDLGPMFEHHRKLRPYLIRDDADTLADSGRELAQTPEELIEYLQFSYCIKCGACVAACPTAALDGAFPGPMPLAAAHRYNADSRDDGFDARRAALAEGRGLTHCHYAGECSRVCPKGVDPARAIQRARGSLIMSLLRLRRRQPAELVSPPAAAPAQDDSFAPPAFTAGQRPDDEDAGEGETT